MRILTGVSLGVGRARPSTAEARFAIIHVTLWRANGFVRGFFLCVSFFASTLPAKMGDGRVALPTRSGDLASRATARRCPLTPPTLCPRPPNNPPPSALPPFCTKTRARPSQTKLLRGPALRRGAAAPPARGLCTGSGGSQRHAAGGPPGRGRSAPAPIPSLAVGRIVARHQ